MAKLGIQENNLDLELGMKDCRTEEAAIFIGNVDGDIYVFKDKYVDQVDEVDTTDNKISIQPGVTRTKI